MLRRRPTPFGGAFQQRRCITHLLGREISRDNHVVDHSIIACCDAVRFGAMLHVVQYIE
jgi:hypothetical protein